MRWSEIAAALSVALNIFGFVHDEDAPLDSIYTSSERVWPDPAAPRDPPTSFVACHLCSVLRATVLPVPLVPMHGPASQMSAEKLLGMFGGI